ncbi:MAG: hypothetical protein IJ269_06980 [Bacteroidales bacterium]|nr:hypothetical protein [Bacteroidales bacterium]
MPKRDGEGQKKGFNSVSLIIWAVVWVVEKLLGSSRKQFLEVALTYPAGVDKKKISSGLVMVGK